MMNGEKRNLLEDIDVMNKIIVTTTDIKKEYEILGMAVFEYPQYVCTTLNELIKRNVENLKGNIPAEIQQNNIAFLAAVEELKKQAVSLNGNGLIGLNSLCIKKNVLGQSNDWMMLYATIVKIK